MSKSGRFRVEAAGVRAFYASFAARGMRETRLQTLEVESPCCRGLLWVEMAWTPPLGVSMDCSRTSSVFPMIRSAVFPRFDQNFHSRRGTRADFEYFG